MNDKPDDDLRDRIAMAALTGIAASRDEPLRYEDEPITMAKNAYLIADAMLKARTMTTEQLEARQL